VRHDTLPVMSSRHPWQDAAWHHPGGLVAIVAGGQLVTWTLAPILTHSSPPLDVVEGYMWGREWVLATYKHPALPSWVLEASRLLTGAVGWPAYLLSQACVATSFLCVYGLGREIMGRARAAAGTLLLTGVAFYAWPTTEFNHNIAEMPLWAAMPLVLWRAVALKGTGKGSGWGAWLWLLLGALAALSMYAKLSSGLLLAALAGWLLWDPEARARLASPWPWIGLLLSALLLAPLAVWLVANDFAPLRYAALRSADGRGSGLFTFVVSELLNLLGMVAVLAIGRAGRRRNEENMPAEPPVAPRALRYLGLLTFGPLALALVGAIVAGASLRTAWGSAMFNFAGLLAVAITGSIDARALRRIALCAGTLILCVPLGYALVVLYAPQRAGTHMRVSWPQAEISRRMAAIWTRRTGAPLGIVAGDDWIAGLVGITAPDTPSILSRGDRRLSPWISAERLHRQGMLIVWDADRERIPPPLQAIVAAGERASERFAWPDGRGADLAIGYVIVPPNSDVR
jgi:4-amino-4-deoxy-L-arabinose transferase-like glycosyltransferase